MKAVSLAAKIERIKWQWLQRFLWPVYRAYKRNGTRLTQALVNHLGVIDTILDTKIPNTPFLKCKSITVVNGYGQTHKHDFGGGE